MRTKGSDGRAVASAVLAGLLAVAISSCSSGPSAEAKTFCHNPVSAEPVSKGERAVDVDPNVIREGEQSGDPGLDAAAAALLKAVNAHNVAEANNAFQKVIAACSRLGLAPTRNISATLGTTSTSLEYP